MTSDMERDCREYLRAGFTIVEAAYELGADGVLNDPTDDEIILAAVEMSRGGEDRKNAESTG